MALRLMIEGKLYDTDAKETARLLNINYSTLMSRVKKNTKKWAEWKVAELDYSIVINNRNFADLDAAIFELLRIKYLIEKQKKEQE